MIPSDDFPAVTSLDLHASQHQHSEYISDSFDFLPGMVPTMDDFSSDSNMLACRSGFNQTLVKCFGYQKNGVGTTYRNFAMKAR